MSILRHYQDPLTIRWYVRRIWYRGGVTRDRVVAQGEFQVPVDSDPLGVVATALQAALTAVEQEIAATR